MIRTVTAMSMILAYGCAPQGSKQPDVNLTPSDDELEDSNSEQDSMSSSQRSPLPAISSVYGDVVDPRPAPSLCGWSGSVDTIVFGTLNDVRVVSDPAIRSVLPSPGEPYPNPDWEWTQTCESGQYNHAVALDIDVTNVLGGPIDLVGQDLTVRVGLLQRERWRPNPRLDETGAVQWTLATPAGGEGLVPGQKIGMALHYVESLDVWSLMGESLFGTDEDGRIIFQISEESGDFEPPPLGVAGLLVSELGGAIAGCEQAGSSADADDRRDWIENTWGPGTGEVPWVPTLYVAAWCMDLPDSE